MAERTATPPATPDRPSVLERFLRLFSDVRAGEGPVVLFLSLNVFLLLLSYYLVKTVREPLILQGGGAEVKAYLSAAQVVLLVPVAKGYDLITRKLGRMKLITWTTIFFASNLVIFWSLARLGVPYLGVAFYVWVGIFSLVIVAQFWSFANDIYDEERGKRMFPIIAAGSALGAVVGGYTAALLPMGAFEIMLVAAVLLVVCVGLSWIVHRRAPAVAVAPLETGARERITDANERRSAPIGGHTDAFKLVLRDRYLLLLAALTMIRNWVNTAGEYIIDRTLTVAAPEAVAAGSAASVEAFIKQYRGFFFGTVNLLELGIQLFLVSRILKYGGVRLALFILPIVSLAGHSAMLAMTTLTVITVAKVAENSIDYSLQNTTQQTLFLLTTREEKYKAKQVIETFFWRVGDVMAAAVIFAGTTWLGFGTRQFIGVNMAMALVWLVVVVALSARHRRREERYATHAAGPTVTPVPA